MLDVSIGVLAQQWRDAAFNPHPPAVARRLIFQSW